MLSWFWALSPLWFVLLFWGVVMTTCLISDACQMGWPKLRECRPGPENPNWYLFLVFQIGMLALAVSFVLSVVAWNPVPFIIVVGLWGIVGELDAGMVLPEAVL